MMKNIYRGSAVFGAALLLAGCGSTAAAHPAHSHAPRHALAAPPAASPEPTTPAGTVNAALAALAARAASYGPSPTTAQVQTFTGYESTNLAGTLNALPESVQGDPIGEDLTNYQGSVAQLYSDMAGTSTTRTVLLQDKSAADTALRALAAEAGTPNGVVQQLS